MVQTEADQLAGNALPRLVTLMTGKRRRKVKGAAAPWFPSGKTATSSSITHIADRTPMNEQALDELSADVRRLGSARVAELSGVKPRKVARFVNSPKSVTMPELERIKLAVRKLEES
jgi:hypothetical protein